MQQTHFTIQQITGPDAEILLAEDPTATIADVRAPDEYAKEHVSGAISLPVNTIEQEAPSALPDKTCAVIVYCRSGRRAALAAEKLDALGYIRILNLGAMTNWTGPTQ